MTVTDPVISDGTDKLVLYSSDCHIGPKLTQLREYCPKKHLDAFDAFVANASAHDAKLGGGGGQNAAPANAAPAELADATSHMTDAQVEEMMGDELALAQALGNWGTSGHHDIKTRLADLNQDGQTGEVIFHGSQNGQMLPFVTSHEATHGFTTPFSFLGIDQEMSAVGFQIYNEWLADQVSLEPDRHVGLVYIPAWDPEASERAVRWGHSRGLRGVNFPAWRPGMPVLQDEAWEPFYAACDELNMPLTNHGGAGDDASWPADEAIALRFVESSYHSRRLIWSLLFHGTFEKYPNLKLMLSEIPGKWWTVQVEELTSIDGFTKNTRRGEELIREHVFQGATFMSRDEALHAVDNDYWQNICWGSDYPHIEGTWQNPTDPEAPMQTHLALRDTFSGIDADKVRAMVGLNLANAYGLDVDKLQKVANSINAPTAEYVSTPLEDADIPANHGMFVFRRVGPWA